MRKNRGQESDIWFYNARQDLETAELLYKADHYTSVICFHVQQAIEKALKGYLSYNSSNPRRIHHLEELIKDCAKYNKTFLDYLDECLIISAYYIESRYPVDMPREYTRQETKDALQAAQRLLSFIQRLVKA